MHAPLRPTTPDDVAYVCAHLRPEDRAELVALSGLPPEHSLPFTASTVGALTMIAPATGDILGLCGVHGCAVPGFGVIWMVCTEAVTRHRRVVLKHCATTIEGWHRHYPRLGNMVDSRNTLHIKWLGLMGFKFTGAAVIGPHSVPFITFEKALASNV